MLRAPSLENCAWGWGFWQTPPPKGGPLKLGWPILDSLQTTPHHRGQRGYTAKSHHMYTPVTYPSLGCCHLANQMRTSFLDRSPGKARNEIPKMASQQVRPQSDHFPAEETTSMTTTRGRGSKCILDAKGKRKEKYGKIKFVKMESSWYIFNQPLLEKKNRMDTPQTQMRNILSFFFKCCTLKCKSCSSVRGFKSPKIS